MWLWIATFPARETGSDPDAYSLLVRARTLRECVRVAETHAARTALGADPHVGHVLDLAQAAPGPEPAVLLATQGEWWCVHESLRPGQVWWSRDRIGHTWTNDAAASEGWPVEDITYDPARHDRTPLAPDQQPHRRLTWRCS